jgi:hypothetical protein
MKKFKDEMPPKGIKFYVFTVNKKEYNKKKIFVKAFNGQRNSIRLVCEEKYVTKVSDDYYWEKIKQGG